MGFSENLVLNDQITINLHVFNAPKTLPLTHPTHCSILHIYIGAEKGDKPNVLQKWGLFLFISAIMKS